MNDVATTSGNGVATNDEYDVFSSYGATASQRQFIGDLLKFAKGEYLYGQEDKLLPVGTELIIDMKSLTIGWLRWDQGSPSDSRMGLLTEHFQPPRRAELGDHDESTWELNDDGVPEDPWRFSNLVVCRSVEGEDFFSFSTSSKGGLGAVGELCKAYAKGARQNPGKLPIVKLGGSAYKHSNPRYGRVHFPVFEIVGWTDVWGGAEDAPVTEDAAPSEEIQAAATEKPKKEAKKAKPQTVEVDDDDDEGEVPF